MLCGEAVSVPFDDTASTEPATAVVDAGGGSDYASLAAAATAFNAVAGGINRPWILLIASDTTETANSQFCNSFGATGALKIKPAPATTPTVQFTSTNGSSGAAGGHLLFGGKSGAPPNRLPSDGNYGIDGSNAEGGTTRDLLLRAGTAEASFDSPSDCVVKVYASTKGVVIENARIEMYDSTGIPAAVGATGTRIGGVNLLPDDCTIRNCTIVGNGTSESSRGVYTSINESDFVESGVSIDNLAIENCDIVARARGIFLNGTGNCTMRGNAISTGTPIAGEAVGILHLHANNDTTFTQTYDGNVIACSAAGTQASHGPTGIQVNPQPLSFDTGTFAIRNNVVLIGGNTVAASVRVRGVALLGYMATYRVEHNTVIVAESAATGGTGTQAYGIGNPASQPFPTTSDAVIRNNYVHFAESDSDGSAFFLFRTAGVALSGNCVVHPGARYGRVVSTDYATQADWRTAFPTYDTAASGAQSVDLTATAPAAIGATTGKWSGTGMPFGVLGVTPVLATTDIDGDPRPPTGAYPGADEFADFRLLPLLPGFSLR